MLLMKNKVKTGGFLDSLTEREKILSSYDDEYIEKVINNLYSSTDTYIIKDLLEELFLEDISDRVIEKFLAVRENVEIDEDTIFGFSRGMEGDIYYTGFAFLSNYEDFDHETIKSNSRCLEVSVNFPIDIFIPHKFIGDIYSYYLYEHIVSSTEPCKADNYYVP